MGLKVGSLGEYIREQRRSAEISLRQLAEAAGVSNPYLSQIERGLRKPSADILQQIAKGLRISAEALYLQAGILEDQDVSTEVSAAIRADGMLTERQKQVLLDIYESFRSENRGAPDAASQAPEEARSGDSGTAGSRKSGSGKAGGGKAADPWEAATDQPVTTNAPGRG